MKMFRNFYAQPKVMIPLFLTLALLTACGNARKTKPTLAAGAALSREDRIEIFEDVWKTINDQYYDPAFHGVDWQEVHHRYRPRVEAAKDDVEFYSLFEVMLAELRDAHTVFSHPRSAADISLFPAGSVGISLEEVEGKTVIVKVDRDSDSARAGVKPGMILRTVNGKSVEDLYAEIRSQFVGSSTDQAMKDVMQQAILYGGFLGPSRTFGIEDFNGKTFQFSIKHFGARPSDSPTLSARRLPSGYGYVKFDEWKRPLDEQFKAELAKLRDTPGLIVDLRGNGGGATEVLLNIGSLFFPNEASFGGFKKRAGTVEEIFTHKSQMAYSGPVVILVDQGSASASEVFTASMQENARARIIGRQTCGCVLNQWSKPEKGGGTLRWSARVYRSPKGSILEGTGIVPDEPIALTISDIRQGRDAALEAAEGTLRAMQSPR